MCVSEMTTPPPNFWINPRDFVIFHLNILFRKNSNTHNKTVIMNFQYFLNIAVRITYEKPCNIKLSKIGY